MVNPVSDQSEHLTHNQGVAGSKLSVDIMGLIHHLLPNPHFMCQRILGMAFARTLTGFHTPLSIVDKNTTGYIPVLPPIKQTLIS
jgi:hypothetical protein